MINIKVKQEIKKQLMYLSLALIHVFILLQLLLPIFSSEKNIGFLQWSEVVVNALKFIKTIPIGQ